MSKSRNAVMGYPSLGIGRYPWPSRAAAAGPLDLSKELVHYDGPDGCAISQDSATDNMTSDRSAVTCWKCRLLMGAP